jgi:AraC-like DNA-binding protein
MSEATVTSLSLSSKPKFIGKIHPHKSLYACCPLLNPESLEKTQEVLTRLIGAHSLKFVTLNSGNICRIRHASTANFNLGNLQWQGVLQLEQKLPESLYVIYFVLEGAIALRINQHQIVDCSPDTPTIFSPGQDLVARTSEQGQVLLISIERYLIEQTLAQTLGRTLKQPVVFAPTIDLSVELAVGLKLMVQSLWQAVAEEAMISDLVVKELEQAFLICLLKGLSHSYSEELLYHCFGALASYVRKAEAFMEANLQADIRLIDIAKAVGVCPRMLEKAFACHGYCSPMQHLKRLRLHRIHEELSNPLMATTVTEAIGRYGFVQSGKFAQAYEKIFGELPSQTLKRHRHH